MSKHSDWRIYKRLLRQARPYWGHIAGIFLLSLLDSPLGLLAPVPLKIAVDSAIGSHPLPDFLDRALPAAVTHSSDGILILAVAMGIAITLLGGLLGLASSFVRNYTAEKLVLDFRARMFRHMQRLSLSYHDSKGTADSIYRIQYDTATLQYIAIDGLPPFITSAFTLVTMFYVTYRLDRQLAMVAMAVSPVLFLLSQKYRPLFRDRSAALKKLESSALGVLQEVLTALRVVKAFGREEHEEERFVRQSRAGMRARIRLDLLGGIYGILVSLTTALGTGWVLWVGVRHVHAGVLTLGSLLLVISYLGQLYSPLKTIGRKAASLQGHLAGAERAFAVLDHDPDVPERVNALPLERASGAVVFKNVSFAYPDNPPVLHDITLEVPAGSRIGISGRTGAGKTTLVSLLTRFYDPTSGEILLDGVDIRDYRLADFRNQFAIVLQEPVLFSTSIAENIAYARPGASEEDIVEAARQADAHDFILKLPNGYQTVVGERGMRLSGGERQRISLARAFLKNAPILLLDEPTSSVDVKTEAAIMEATERLMRGRTTFLIAHRLSTLDSCDIRLELEHGRVLSMTMAKATIRDEREIGFSPAMFEPENDPLTHAVTTAWLRSGTERPNPERVEILKVKPEPMIYRLAGAAAGGGDVIAKRCYPHSGLLERAIYEDILPRLPFTSLRSYGFVEERGENGYRGPSWLFLEDAGGEKYSSWLPEHRLLGSRWLATMHTAAARIPLAAQLPDRGPDWYLSLVKAVREGIAGGDGNPYLRKEHWNTLKDILLQCDILEERWCEITEFCGRMPRTLVHADLSRENVRIRDGKTVLVLDWETAGWGIPATDFANLKGMLCPEIETYASVVRPSWPSLETRDFEELIKVGTMFRLIFTMSVQTANLRYDWVEEIMNHLMWLQEQMADSFRSVGWSDAVDAVSVGIP